MYVYMYVCIYHTHTYNFEGAGELLKHRTWGARSYSHHISSPTALRPACCKKPKLDYMQNPYGGTQDYMKREAPRLHEEPVPSCCSFHCSCFTSLTATSCNTLSWTFSNFLPTETVRDNKMMIVVSSHKKKKKKKEMENILPSGNLPISGTQWETKVLENGSSQGVTEQRQRTHRELLKISRCWRDRTRSSRLPCSQYSKLTGRFYILSAAAFT